MTGRSGTNPRGGRPGSRQTTQLAEFTASPEIQDPYGYYEDGFDADEEDYDDDDDDDDDPSSVHIEDKNTITSFPRQPRYYQQLAPPQLTSSAHGPSGDNSRSRSTTTSSPIPHVRDQLTYQSSPPAKNPPAGLGRRVCIRRGVAREPRAHLSSIPEDSASTAFPYTIQGPGQRIVRPLPPIPAGAGQQQQTRGPAGPRVQKSFESNLSLLLKKKEKEEGEGAHSEKREDQ